MVFPITMSDLPLEFDSLAALKCTHWQPGAHRVYTMARLYLLQGDLQASLSAFERRPPPGSSILLSLGNGAQALHACLSPDTAALLHAGAAAAPADVLAQGSALNAQRFSGVDEQGWYWGARLSIPQNALAKAGVPPLADAPFPGVLAKFQNGQLQGAQCAKEEPAQFLFVAY